MVHLSLDRGEFKRSNIHKKCLCEICRDYLFPENSTLVLLQESKKLNNPRIVFECQEQDSEVSHAFLEKHLPSGD